MAAPIGHAALKGSEVPQHATFAHSKEDVLNALSFYFGQPVSPEKLKDYSEHHAATCTLPLLSRSSPAPLPLPLFYDPERRNSRVCTDHFPDAYAGQNTTIRDTINNLIEKSPQNWHTTVGLPFRRIEGTVRTATSDSSHNCCLVAN